MYFLKSAGYYSICFLQSARPPPMAEPMLDQNEDRRKFLKTCGRFAVVTPPAMTMLLSTSLTSDAIAKSGNNGGGNGGDDGSPNGKPDTYR
jgi:hypothetical protein